MSILHTFKYNYDNLFLFSPLMLQQVQEIHMLFSTWHYSNYKLKIVITQTITVARSPTVQSGVIVMI
jgi:hypothetical protein